MFTPTHGLPMVQSPRTQTFDLSFTEVAAESHLKLLSTVAQAVKGQGTICWVDCGYVLGAQGILAGLGVSLGPLVAEEEERVW